MTSERRSRAQWKILVRKWKSSGETAKSFAAAHDLNPASLYWWSRELKRQARAAPAAFVPIEVAQLESAPTLMLQVAEVCVHIPIGADIAYVTSLLSALRSSSTPC